MMMRYEHIHRHFDQNVLEKKVMSRELIRCDIADEVGDWCGSIVLDPQWIMEKKSSKQEFIAISEAKNFTKNECKSWSYYIPKERDQSEWDLFYVLLIQWKSGKWEGVGSGKVFKESFKGASWKEIMMA